MSERLTELTALSHPPGVSEGARTSRTARARPSSACSGFLAPTSADRLPLPAPLDLRGHPPRGQPRPTLVGYQPHPHARVLLPQQPGLPGHVCLRVQSAPGLARRWVAVPVTSPGQRLARWPRGCAWGLWRASRWPPWPMTALWPWVSPCWPGPRGPQPSYGPWSP